jgi:hypothetical protein
MNLYYAHIPDETDQVTRRMLRTGRAIHWKYYLVHNVTLPIRKSIIYPIQ